MTSTVLTTIAFIDGAGVYGSVLHYSLIIAFVGSALLMFIYYWKKGRLDMDEEPALEMLKSDEHTTEEWNGPRK